MRFAMRAVFLLRIASQLHPHGDRASAIDAGRYQLPLRGSSGIGLARVRAGLTGFPLSLPHGGVGTIDDHKIVWSLESVNTKY